MTRFVRIGLLTTASMIGSMSGTGAAAQSASAAEEADAIIVTARRFEERLQDVPISVTVYNQEALDQRNIVNPAELATYTPSLSANRQYGTEKSSFSIRGFVQELGTQPSVAVYFADVVAPRSQGPTPSGNGTLPGTLFDLQNVQVLKGPQGTLFGRNTTGGAVLFVPRKPTDALEGYVEGSVGNFDARRFQGVVNIPLADTFKVRLGVDRMTRDGYLRNRSGIGPDDFANVDYWAARASVVADLTPDLENYLVATYNLSDTNGHLGQVFTCARTPIPNVQFLAPFGCGQVDRQIARGDGFYDVENDVPDPRVRLEQWQVINTTTWRSSDALTVKNIVSYAQFEEQNRTNFFGDRLLLQLSPTLVFPFRLSAVEPGPAGPNASQYTFTEELQFQGHSGPLTWQAGGYLELSNPLRANTQLNQLFINCANAAAFQCVPALGLTSSVGVIDQKYRFRNMAAYAQATYDITEQFSATGGIRYTSDRIRARSRNTATRFVGPLATPFTSCSKNATIVLGSIAERAACEEVFVEKSSRPTWLLGLDYNPADDVLLYAKYARGYRQGTINLLPLSNALNTSGPEKVDTYEIGAKAGFAGPVPGNVAVALFHNDFTDQQLQANTIPRPGLGVFPVNVLVNAGKSRISGLEADLSLRPFAGLRVEAGYAYLDTKLKEFTPPDLSADPFYSGVISSAALGGDLVNAPKHRLTVSGNYTLPIAESMGRLSVGATYTYTSKQFSNHAADAFAFQVGFNPGLLPSTELVNLNLDWTDVGGLPVDLSLFATNVTKEKYAVYSGGLMQLGYDVRVIGEPRMYGARLRFKFGD